MTSMPDLSDLNPGTTQATASDCWNSIGIGGDFSCGELKQFIHCRNCPVYSAAGRSLLDRDSSSDYIADRTRILASDTDQRETIAGDTQSLVIFRLGDEWLALPANLFIEVTEPSLIHSLPHRSNKVLLGLINIRGEIQMCVSLKAMLQLDNYATNSGTIGTNRLVVLEREGERWVFLVDELHGIRRVQASDLSNVPATVSKVPQTYTSALLNWDQARVSVLDDELLFYTLNRQLL